ncbi:transcriptional regulator NanR [Jannaschia seosinensis]|uniref:Transcriptional regulator NanR n=1 Tax=Jannaschia seosinensis TaxID=313367 RepID=A0A0M7BFP6_9RHOB|nr:GntR family transcriptional regulator [Jannaschia seosinensis]CUH40674.1 transcriptional regulator NanR [Jannaschia seosinensis]
MVDTALPETPLRAHAYSSFTKRLLAREIVPGQIISQRELVDVTGMPLGAIREMIPRLEADGLIRTVPKRGLQVVTIDLDLIRDAFQLRRLVETEAFARYAETASEAEIDRHEAAHRAIHDAAHAGVTPELLDRAQVLDWAFHDHVVDALGNRILSDIHRVNAIKIRLIRNADTRMLPDLVTSVIDEHLAVIRALRTRDPGVAAGAIGGHIESARRRALGV